MDPGKIITGAPVALRYDQPVYSDEFRGFRVALWRDQDLNPESAADTDEAVIVDVVDPIWELGDVDLDTGTIKLKTKDKFFNTSTLDEDDITVYVNNVESTTVEIDLTSVAPTNITETVNGVANTVVGKEYTLKLSNITQSESTPGNETYTTFTPTNLTSDSLNNTAGFKYRQENGGAIKIEIAAGVTTDTSGNGNNTTTFDVGLIDNVGPQVYDVQKIQNASGNKDTLIFNVTDRYYDSTDLVTKDEITLWIDDVQLDALINNATLTYKPIKATVDGATTVLGHQYTLVISNITETLKQTGKEYYEWSGTLKITIDADASKDTEGNTINPNTTTITDFVDYIKPEILYQYAESSQAEPGDIDYDGKTFTMVFDVIDKYINTNSLTVDDLTVLIDGKLPGDDDGNGSINGTETLKIITIPSTVEQQNANKDKVWKNLTVEDIEAETAFNKTVGGAIVNDTHVIGKRFTLVLSNLEQLQIKSGAQFLDYSGIITVGIPAGKVTDTKENGNPQTTITSGVDIPGGAVGDSVIVDVVDPFWQKVSSSATPATSSTATITVRGTDKYYASSTLTDKIKVYVHQNGAAAGALTEVTSSVDIQIDPTVTPVYKAGTTDVQVGADYTITITGWEQNVNQLQVEILEDAMLDASGNGSKPQKFILYNVLELTNTETAATSRFLGESSIQRQNIQQVVFVNSTDASKAAGVRKVWDVSAAGNNSILAWYSETSAPYTVYIGSDDEIFANPNSSYLFSYIGYATNCTATSAVLNLNLLNENYVTNMSYMFNKFGFRSMTSLNLGEFNTQHVTNMSNMFNGCGTTAMTTFSLGTSFYTSEVTDMSNMFNGCGQNGITTFTLGNNFNTAKVQIMSGMFQNFGHKLTSLNLGSSFYTSEVTNMSNMFNGTGKTSMTALTLGNNFDTSKVTDMSGMFQDCGTTALRSLDLGNYFYTTTVMNMNNMFYGCGTTAMTKLDLGPAFTSIPTADTNMFVNCGTTSLTIYAPEAVYKNRQELKTQTMIYISYDANSGSGAPHTQGVIKGKTTILSTKEPTKTGYRFVGWATSPTATEKEYDAGSTITPTENLKLYAVWEVNIFWYFKSGTGLAPGYTGFTNASYDTTQIYQTRLASGGGTNGTITSKEPIDVTNYNTVHFSGVTIKVDGNDNAHNTGVWLSVGPKSYDFGYSISSGTKTLMSDGSFTLDLSDVTGPVYLKVSGWDSGDWTQWVKVYIKNIWFD